MRKAAPVVTARAALGLRKAEVGKAQAAADGLEVTAGAEVGAAELDFRVAVARALLRSSRRRLRHGRRAGTDHEFRTCPWQPFDRFCSPFSCQPRSGIVACRDLDRPLPIAAIDDRSANYRSLDMRFRHRDSYPVLDQPFRGMLILIR